MRFSHVLTVFAILGFSAGPVPAQTAPGTLMADRSSSIGLTGVVKSMDQFDDATHINVGDQLSFRILETEEQPVTLIVSDSERVEVKVIRKIGQGEKICFVDLRQVLDKARGDLDFGLRPGDVIMVPARLINW